MKNLKRLITLSFLFFVGISSVNAAPLTLDKDDIANDTYIIGKHLFDTNRSSLTTQDIMWAARSIDEGPTTNIDDMVIYYKNFNGEWINGLTGQTITPKNDYRIDYINKDELKEYTIENNILTILLPGDYTGYPEIDGQNFDGVIIAEGIGNGDVILNNVTVNGDVVILGGGSNSVYFKNSKLINVEIAKELKPGAEYVRVVFLDGTTVDLVKSNSESAKIVLGEDANIAKIEISAPNTKIEVEEGKNLQNEPEVEVKAENAVINVPVSKITIDEEVENVEVNGTEIVSNELIAKDENSLLYSLTLESMNIKLGSDITLTKTIKINRPVIIDGSGYTIDGSGITTDEKADQHAIIVLSDDVVIKDLTIVDPIGFGIQVYDSKNVELNNITVENSNKGGILINGSEVSITDITLKNNTWGGIEVSQGKNITEEPSLYLGGEINYVAYQKTPIVWIDGKDTNDGWVTIENDDYVELAREKNDKGQDAPQLWFVPEDSNLYPTLIDITEPGEVVLSESNSFVLKVKADDIMGLYSLEIDHNYSKEFPEFTVYASKDNPYGGDGDAFAGVGATVAYDTEKQEWTIDFGPDITDIFREKGITIYIVIKSISGNKWGSMYSTSPENTFKYIIIENSDEIAV